MLGNLDAARDWGHAKDYVECHVVNTTDKTNLSDYRMFYW